PKLQGTTVTQLDTLTLRDLDNAIDVLADKIKTTDGSVSEATKKKAQKLQAKYIAQKGKTIRMYEKNKKKGKLVGVNKSTLSVKKMLEMEGKTVNVATSAAAEFFNGENIAAIIASGVALGGLMSVGDGFGMKLAWKGITAACKAMFTTGAWNAVGSSLLLAGGGALAVIMAKKAIKKNMNKNAILRDEAESGVDKKTYRDHSYISNTAAQSKLAAEAAVNEEAFNHLLQIAANPNNDPKVISQANKILAEARVLQAKNKYQAEVSVLEAHLNAGTVTIGGKEESIGDLYKRNLALREIEDLSTTRTTTVTTTETSGKIFDAVKLANDNTKLKEQKEVVAKDKATYIASFGTSGTPLTDAQKTSLEAAYDKMKANVEYSNKLAAGDFELDGGDIKINGKKAVTIKGEADAALVKACKNAGLIDEATVSAATTATAVSKLATQLRAKYGTHLATINQNMTAEMDAAMGK
ncbi:MAG: hypothetical protein IJA23_06430, partial [Clostridia bacterium]|nr:hypothetical protein [Clostridia bacterium]